MNFFNFEMNDILKINNIILLTKVIDFLLFEKLHDEIDGYSEILRIYKNFNNFIKFYWNLKKNTQKFLKYNITSEFWQMYFMYTEVP